MSDSPTRQEILDTLKESRSQLEAAQKLGISRHALYRKLKYGDLQPNFTTEKLSVVEEHRLRKELSKTRKDLDEVLSQLETTKRVEDFLEEVNESVKTREVPTWVLGQDARGQDSSAIACYALSDIHFGEVVSPKEVEYLNGYNIGIATARLERFFKNSIRMQKEFLNLEFDGTVMFWLGDFISGDIHEELRETNEKPSTESVLELTSILTSGLRLMADELGDIHIKAVVGNHGRTTKKPQAKQSITSSFDWLIYQLVSREFRDDSRITFDISDATDVRATILNTKYLATHGDQFRGGSGISAMMAPLMLGNHRKKVRSVSVHKPHDWMVSAHIHTYIPGAYGILTNGSVIGYNEYAYKLNYAFEPPQQSFWVTDSEHGVTFRTPIHVIGEDEPWREAI